jgi:plastocyanin
MKNSVNSKVTNMIRIAFITVILIISNSCSKSSMDNMYGTGSGGGTKGTGPGANEVWIQSYAFNPTTITVDVGTTITWTNKDGVAHTITPDAGVSEVFGSGTINPSGTFSHMFSTAGSFTYHCSIHPAMTATVIVKEVVATPGY